MAEAGGLPGGSVTLTSNVDTGSHRQWMDAVCNNINNVLDDDNACTVNPVPTFADFRNRITSDEMTGMFRTGWQMDYPSIENFLAPLYGTNASSNDTDYSNKAVDAKLAEAKGKLSKQMDDWMAQQGDKGLETEKTFAAHQNKGKENEGDGEPAAPKKKAGKKKKKAA